MKFASDTATTFALPKGQTEGMVFDDAMPGLALRVRAGGSRAWVYQYKISRRNRRVTIGNANVISLAKARKRRLICMRKFALGRILPARKRRTAFVLVTRWRRHWPHTCHTSKPA